jgi:hypothetical protein
MTGLSRAGARGVEQLLIAVYGLEALDNMRNEIAKKNITNAGLEGARAMEIVSSTASNILLELMGK